MQSRRLKEFVITQLRPLLGSSVAAAAAAAPAGGAAAGDATVHAAGGAVGLLCRVEAVDLQDQPTHRSVLWISSLRRAPSKRCLWCLTVPVTKMPSSQVDEMSAQPPAPPGLLPPPRPPAGGGGGGGAAPPPLLLKVMPAWSQSSGCGPPCCTLRPCAEIWPVNCVPLRTVSCANTTGSVVAPCSGSCGNTTV